MMVRLGRWSAKWQRRCVAARREAAVAGGNVPWRRGVVMTAAKVKDAAQPPRMSPACDISEQVTNSPSSLIPFAMIFHTQQVRDGS